MAQVPGAKLEESKSDVLLSLRKELMEGSFDEAKRVERENLLATHVVSTIANSIYDTLLLKQHYPRAIELAQKYSLGDEKVQGASQSEFRQLVGQNKIEEALAWGLKWKLSNLEISRAAIKGIEIALLEGDVAKAVDMKGHYKITLEQIGTLWIKGYDLAIESGRYLNAATLSRDFGSSERKTLLTASKAFRDAIKHDRYDEVAKIETEFQFFKNASVNLMGDDECKALTDRYQQFFQERVAHRDTENLLKVIEGSRILLNLYTNQWMTGLVAFIFKNSVEFHGLLLKEDAPEQARALKDQLGLMEDRVPVDLRRRIMDQALEYHNSTLVKGDYEKAKTVKDSYKLLGLASPSDIIAKTHEVALEYFSDRVRNGEIQKAKFILDEYGLPRNELTHQLVEDLKDLLRNEKFKVSFDMILEFKVPTIDLDLKGIAQTAFEKCMDQGYYETAADLGHVFDIKSPQIKEAARFVWQRAMEAEDYKKARSIKRKHHLGRRDTADLAFKAYQANMDRNKPEIARRLREEYKISLGFMDMLFEFFKTLFGFLFK